MGDVKRLYREDPDRIGPIRSFSGLYHSPPSESPNSSSYGPSSNGTPIGEQDGAGDESVGLAYRVIDKHISDGKKNAGRFNDRPYNSRPVADGFQELLERTLRYQSELLPL